MLDVSPKSIIAVVGCGGKTSLIELIATEKISKCTSAKVLISPTTKILPMTLNNTTLGDTQKSCNEHEAKPGIQCLGIKNKKSGKLEALPEKILADIVLKYDIALLEADGSRQLQCKGWLENEPVIPQYCTHTLGVLTINPIGKPTTKKTVHNLPEFLTLTGLHENDIITEKALEKMVTCSQGMFKNSVGDMYLIINQVEAESDSQKAEAFLKSIKAKYPNRFKNMIYGSIRGNSWKKL